MKKIENPLEEAEIIRKSVEQNSHNVLRQLYETSIKEQMAKIITESPDYEEDEVDPDNVDSIGTDISGGEDVEIPDEGVEDVETGVEEEPLPDGEETEVDVDIEGDVEGVEVSDSTYDLGSMGNNDLLKIFKAVKAGDSVIVNKVKGGYEISDNETGADYIVKTGEGEDGDEEYEIEIGECITEDNINLGYTDNYQKQTPLTTTNPDCEPSKNKDWNKLPTQGDNNRNYGGKPEKSNSQPFTEDEEINVDEGEEIELDEAGETRTKRNLRQTASVKSEPQVKNTAGKRVDKVRQGAQLTGEQKIANLQKEMHKLTEDNKILAESVKQFREHAAQYYTTAKEIATLNYKLGKVINLIGENTTTAGEKKSIIERMETVKTKAQIDQLYESIKVELKSKKPIIENVDNTFLKESREGAANQKPPVYISESAKSVLNLMERVNKV
jgi:hypothetical protein